MAAIAAVSLVGVVTASAETSTPEHPFATDAAVPRTAASPRPNFRLPFESVAAEPAAAMLRTKLDMGGSGRMLRHALRKPQANCISGIASMYNPTKRGDRSGGLQTASGELYETEAWAAAIQVDLRNRFSGVRFGRKYTAAFALVTLGEKSAVVRINDVGPLLPGRVIDLTEGAMRYFDATLQRGILPDIRITPLQGERWHAGPVESGLALTMAGDYPDRRLH